MVKFHNEATLALVQWMQETSGLPAQQWLIDSQQELYSRTNEAVNYWSNFRNHFQLILDAEVTNADAQKAATKANGTAEHGQLAANAAATQAAVAQAVAANVKPAIAALCASQTDSWRHLSEATAHMLQVVSNYPEVAPGPIAFEGLWDEPRMAMGNSALKPPVAADGGAKLTAADEFASFQRPVDGDTRAKYAKKYNGVIKEVLEAHREFIKAVDTYHAKRTELANYFLAWVSSSPQLQAYNTAANYLKNYEAQFTTLHISELKKSWEAVFRTIEPHVAVVPLKDASYTIADPTIPKRRAADAKRALVANLTAVNTFAKRGMDETQSFYNASMAQMP